MQRGDLLVVVAALAVLSGHGADNLPLSLKEAKVITRSGVYVRLYLLAYKSKDCYDYPLLA